MHILAGHEGRDDAIIALFTRTFADAEGEKEGALIGALVRRQLSDTPEDDLTVFLAIDAGALVGASVFSRLVFDHDPRTVFLLSPMAVATERQGEGIGQALISHALQALRADGADIAMTYGDPAYYGQVGFKPVSEDFAPAPLALSQPQGWLAQSLTPAPLTALAGPSRCIAALNDPALW